MEIIFEEEAEVRLGVEILGEVKETVMKMGIMVTTLGVIEVNSNVIIVKDLDIMHLNVENRREIRTVIEIEKKRELQKLISHRHKMMSPHCYLLSARKKMIMCAIERGKSHAKVGSGTKHEGAIKLVVSR